MADNNTASDKPPQSDIKPGDEVQWNYGAGHPSGTVAEVNGEPGSKIEVETMKGNIVHKNANPDNPAVRIGTKEGKSDVVKKASELTKTGDGGGEKEAKVGEKREREGEETQAAGGDAAEENAETEQEAAEKDAGRGIKKPKLDELGTTTEEKTEGSKKAGDAPATEAPAGRGGKRGRGRGGKAARGAPATQPPRTSSRTTRKSTAAAAAAKASEDAGKGLENVSGDTPAQGESQNGEEKVISTEGAPAEGTRSHN